MGRNPHCPLFLVACALRRLRTTPRKSKVKAAVKIGSGGGNSARPRGDQVAAFFVWALQSYPRHKVGKERGAKQCTTCRFHFGARHRPNISSSLLPVWLPSKLRGAHRQHRQYRRFVDIASPMPSRYR